MECRYLTIVLIVSLTICYTNGHSTQRPSSDLGDDDSNPFLDMATAFLRDTLTNNNGQGGGDGGRAINDIGGIASLIGTMMQADGGKSNNGGLGAAQLISGLGSLLANNNGARSNGGGFDASMIGNVIEMLTASDSDSAPASNKRQRRKRQSTNDNQSGFGLDSIISVASAFFGNSNEADGSQANGANDGLMSLLPMLMQTVNSFVGAEGERLHAKHSDHALVLPPFLEKIHIMWDHFASSELAEALWQKSGINLIFKVSHRVV